jgi:hypothetical protein
MPQRTAGSFFVHLHRGGVIQRIHQASLATDWCFPGRLLPWRKGRTKALPPDALGRHSGGIPPEAPGAKARSEGIGSKSLRVGGGSGKGACCHQWISRQCPGAGPWRKDPCSCLVEGTFRVSSCTGQAGTHRIQGQLDCPREGSYAVTGWPRGCFGLPPWRRGRRSVERPRGLVG